MSVMERQIAEHNDAWEQDAVKIGEVLRAHLAVEHFLTKYLEFTNPKLGSLEDTRFADKVKLIGTGGAIEMIRDGISRLNKIRNRIAHTLKADVTIEDRDAFLAVGLFAAMRNEVANRGYAVKCDDPMPVLQEFAKFATVLLQAGASPQAALWAQAMNEEIPS